MKKVLIIATVALTGFLCSCGNAGKEVTKEISPKEALELAKKDVLFVDVRSNEEVKAAAYDVKNSINIPLDELAQNLSKLPKNKQLVLVCKSGVRSVEAYDLLKEKGYTNISAMRGGMDEWTALKYPVVNGKACCADPTSANCNPDGTCKPTVEKACCENPTGEKCNPDGTCKEGVKCTDSEKEACKATDKACCATGKK